jgi:hypothetical protein
VAGPPATDESKNGFMIAFTLVALLAILVSVAVMSLNGSSD